jgi:hypothetical protein
MIRKNQAVGSVSAPNSFTTIQTTSGTSPVADSSSDTLTLTAGAGITVTGDSATDTVTIAATEPGNTAHLADAADAHAASAITNTPSGNLAATTVQAALNELQTDVDGRVSSVTGTSPIVSSGGTTPAISLDAETLLDTTLSPRNYFYVKDDWITGGASGECNWSSSNVSTTAPLYKNPGIVSISTTTSSTGSGRIWGQSAVPNHRLGAGRTAYETVVCLEALSDGTETYSLIAGITSSASYTPSDGIGFRYQHATNSGYWQGFTAAGSSRTDVNSSVTPSTGTTFQTLKWVLNAAGTSVEFFIDGVSIGTSSTNIPANTTNIQFNWYILKSVGTTARIFYVDAMSYLIKFATPR